ncbi:hypothetical protein Tco_1381367, partial [Tanacetum coccineum]
NRESLFEDILGATAQRDTGSYYSKRYWELLPKEILGAITQRDTVSYYPKRDWDVLWENRAWRHKGEVMEVPLSNERPLENKELNAIIGAWFTLWRD